MLPAVASVVPVIVGVLSLVLSGAETVITGAVVSVGIESVVVALATGCAGSIAAEAVVPVVSYPAVAMVASPHRQDLKR